MKTKMDFQYFHGFNLNSIEHIIPHGFNRNIIEYIDPRYTYVHFYIINHHLKCIKIPIELKDRFIIYFGSQQMRYIYSQEEQNMFDLINDI